MKQKTITASATQTGRFPGRSLAARAAGRSILAACAVAALGLGSCSKSTEGGQPAEGTAVRPEVTILTDAATAYAAPATRAAITDTKFPASTPDVFRMTAYKGAGTPTDFSAPYFADAPVNTDASSNPRLATPRYYPLDGTALSFYAWSPSVTPSAGTGNDAPQALYTLSGQEDILWAADASGIGYGNPQRQPSLTFSHLLKRITFHISAGTGFNDGVYKVTSLKILGAKTSARLNTVTGTLEFDNTPTADLTVYDNATGIAITAAGTDIPGSVMFEPGETFLVAVTAGGVEYDALPVTLTGTDAGKAGKSHRVKLTFKGTELVVTTVEIENWTDTDGGTIDVLPQPPVRANSAMVKPGEEVIFDVADRVEKAKTATSALDLSSSWAFDTEYTPLVIWQDVQGLVSQLAYDQANGVLTVTTDAAKGSGNAVVGLFPSGTTDPAAGTCIWSWHVWVTTYQPDGSKDYGLTANQKAVVIDGEVHTYGEKYIAQNPNKVIMDRNLGATRVLYTFPTSNNANYPTYGLLYQWGRKDPIPKAPKGDVADDTTAVQTTYNANGQETGYPALTQGPVAMGDAVKNPHVFYYNITYPNDWNSVPNNLLWGGSTTKSVYDPCPEGWRVAPKGIWDDFGQSWGSPFGKNEGWTNANADLAGGLYTAGDVKAFYPASGGRRHNSGLFFDVGIDGYCWASTDYEYGVMYAYNLDFYYGGINVSSVSYRAHGFPVRCIQE